MTIARWIKVLLLLLLILVLLLLILIILMLLMLIRQSERALSKPVQLLQAVIDNVLEGREHDGQLFCDAATAVA
jgi:uncharacterized SAM-binding protein YcdF (DUF218 family)